MSNAIIFLLTLLPLLVCSQQQHNDAIDKACTSIALQDRSIPRDFCYATLATARSADPGDLAEAATLQAQNFIHNIQMDMAAAEGQSRGDPAAAGRYNECMLSFYTGSKELVSAEEVLYEGRNHGYAIRHLRNALREVQGALGTCERLLAGLKQIAVGDKQVDTAIKIAEKALLHRWN